MGKIIVLEDNTLFAEIVCRWLQREGWKTETVTNISRAKKQMEKADTDDIVLADLRLPDGESTTLLEWMRKNGMEQPFIVMTDYAEVHTAVSAMKLGSVDYIPKKLLEDKLMPTINGIVQKQIAAKATLSAVPIFQRDSAAFRQIKERIRLVAPTDMSVLILGENGTGKEHIAQRIHTKSKRADKPFVSVDCGSISPSLAQSAFFGHIKGAFTNAVCDKVGYFVQASGGTIFLDEIGNLSYDVQVQLLRVLEERKVRPVGGDKEIAVDVRIISATNEKLKKAVLEGTFREDLYHRLNEFSLQALSLRERKNDIPIFAHHFLAISNRELGKEIIGFEDSVMEIFRNYNWPGNLREMRNVVKRATLLCLSDFISVEHIPAELSQVSAPIHIHEMGKTLKNEKYEIELIRDALAKCNNNKSEAARLLKIDRKTLYNKMKLYAME